MMGFKLTGLRKNGISEEIMLIYSESYTFKYMKEVKIRNIHLKSKDIIPENRYFSVLIIYFWFVCLFQLRITYSMIQI